MNCFKITQEFPSERLVRSLGRQRAAQATGASCLSLKKLIVSFLFLLSGDKKISTLTVTILFK